MIPYADAFSYIPGGFVMNVLGGWGALLFWVQTLTRRVFLIDVVRA